MSNTYRGIYYAKYFCPGEGKDIYAEKIRGKM